MKQRTLIVITVLGLLGAAFAASSLFEDSDGLVYTEASVTRGEVESIVATSGTLEAMNTVIVGSQLSGQIAAIYTDFNQPVREGDLIARIDPRTFEARVAQNRADVAVAQATIVQREAELSGARATLAQAERELARRQSLRDRGYISVEALDIDVTSVAVSRAGVETAAAAVTNAQAALAQRRSALHQSELDLERTEIRAPIAGTVVNRTVQQGQTVAASLQAPELFQIAEDLHRMKVEASVDEADIGQIREGMACRFTVDAYPERTFRGRVSQVRIAPDRLLNVVTYRVIIATDNDDLALLPGMTANVEVVLGSRQGVLRVPGAALRFSPRDKDKSDAEQSGKAGTAESPEARRDRAGVPRTQVSGESPSGALVSRASEPGPRQVVLWTLDGGRPVARPVVIGLADDTMTEIVDGLAEGDRVIVRASRIKEQ